LRITATLLALVWAIAASCAPRKVYPQPVSAPLAGGGAPTSGRPANVHVPRTHVHAFKPWSQGMVADTGTAFAGKTAVVTMEIPDDATMAQLVLANQGAKDFTLAVGSIWGSSRLFALGYTGATYGLTPYDDAGVAVTHMQPFSFGAGGADVSPSPGPWPSPPASGVSLTTMAPASPGSTSLMFGAGLACPPDGSTVVTVSNPASHDPAFAPGTTTAAGGCASGGAGTIAISRAPRKPVPRGQTVYFLPPNITVAASHHRPLQDALIYSDWVPIQTYPRLDGPFFAGMTMLDRGSALGGAISAVGATSITLSGDLSQDIPAGTALQACLTATTSGTVTPNATLQFAANSNIAPGQRVFPGRNTDPTYAWPANAVASASTSGGATKVVLASPLPEWNGSARIGAGSTFTFLQPVTVTAPALTGQSAFYVSTSDARKLAAGWTAWAGGGSNGFAGTIGSIDASTGRITMSGNLISALPASQTVYFVAATAATTAPAMASIELRFAAPVANMVSGMTAVHAHIPAGDYIFRPTGTTADLVYAPTSTIGGGSIVHLCNTVTTSAVSPAGQADIHFSRTTYPNRLVTLRLNYAGSPTHANFFAQNIDLEARWVNLPGVPQRWLGYACAATSGVLKAADIGNTDAGGCHLLNWTPVFAVKFYTPGRGIDIVTVGDSHFEGDTTTGSYANFGNRLAALLNHPGVLPVWPVNLGWGGQPSRVYGPNAYPLISDLKPSVVAIQFTTANDGTTEAAREGMRATANAIARLVKGYGGLPILMADYQRQQYGVTVNGSPREAIRLEGAALIDSLASHGSAPAFDPNPILADPMNGPAWLSPKLSWDGVHANDLGHAALATALEPVVCGNLHC
jgi:hypothetical protein